MTTLSKQPASQINSKFRQWGFWLAIFRVVLAVLCLLSSLSAAPGKISTIAPWLWGLYVAYAVAAIFLKTLEQLGFRQLGLLVDVVFLILCVTMQTEHSIGLTSLFFLFVLMAAALEHTAREVIVVVLIACGFLFFLQPVNIVVLSPALLLSGTAVFIVSLQKKLVQDKLKAATLQAQMSRGEAVHAREAERQRIAADFHDGPLQSFVGIQMRLEVVRKMLERDPRLAMEELKQLQDLTKSQSAELRSWVRSMRPVEIDGAGLAPSIRKLVEMFEKESGISATMLGVTADASPDPQTAREILQVVREALHNVQKHSKASRVTVAIGKQDGFFELSVSDDGTGFPFAGTYSLEELELLRLGPVSIRRRVRGLNGEMLLESQPGKGSGVRVRVPL